MTIRDLAGDGDHYAATVISASFKGKSRVQQHQLVYEALKTQMGGVLHALALQTATPEALMADTGGVRILSPAGRHHADRHLEPGRARRRFRFRRRHARHRPGDRHAGRRSRTSNQTEHSRTCWSSRDSEGARSDELRSSDRVRDRYGGAAPAGEQGSGGIMGRRPYPPRTIVEVAKLNQDDIFEVEGTFFAPKTA